MRLPLALLLLVLPVRAAADPAPTVIDLSYDGYKSGFRVFSMQSELLLTQTGYHITMVGETKGVIGFFYHARWRTSADGVWTDPGVRSLHFENRGVFGGQPRYVKMDFVHGDAEVLAQRPVDDGEHLPVSPDLEHNVIDSLSLTALVLRQFAMLGHCEGRVTTFDGRQIEAITLRSAGAQALPPTDRSVWHGPALRCVLDARALSGFFVDEKPKPKQETIWMGHVLPGTPLLPVRMTATFHHLGHTVLYLTSARLRDTGPQAEHRP